MKSILDAKTRRLRYLLSRIVGRALSEKEMLRWLKDARLVKLLNESAFVAYFAHWTPATDPRPFPSRAWRHGGGKNAPHANPDPKVKMPGRVKKIEDEIERVMALPPFPGRKTEIDRLKRKVKHVRGKGEYPGDTDAMRDKNYQPPGIREDEGIDDD